MSKFNTYMEQADTIVKEAFTTIQATEAAFKAAREAKDRGPRRGGSQDARTAVEAARLEADYLEAKQAADNAQRNLPYETASKLAAIRRELAAAVDEAYSATPSDVDPATMTLLQSGILKPAEYERLFNDALEKDNTTMARIIGKSVQTEVEKYEYGSPEAQTLNTIIHQSKDTGGAAYLSTYDAVVDVMNRCLHNPSMIKSYDSLVGEVIRDF